MRYALKFAYDGSVFDGYARQPEGKTIEGEILLAMKHLGIIEDANAGKFQSASRTDNGVSAGGNVIAINTDFKKEAIIPALNSGLKNIAFWALANVADDFNARHAKQRWYRYLLLQSKCPSKKALEATAQTFIGEHDFRSLSKKDTGEENTILKIDSIEIQESGDFLFIDVKAQGFLWQMVRRLVSAMLVDDFSSGVQPMPAENLILMDVIYDFPFETVEKTSGFSTLHNRARIRMETLNQICDIISSA